MEKVNPTKCLFALSAILLLTGVGCSQFTISSSGNSSAATTTSDVSPTGTTSTTTGECGTKYTLYNGQCIDSDPSHFSYVESNIPALPGKIQVEGVDSGEFNPSRLSNWNYDERGVVLKSKSGHNRNIYAPQAVFQGGTFWNVYFGGFDGSEHPNDEVSMTTTADNFNSFGEHAVMIQHGPFTDVNNDSVVKVSDNDWRMVYTTYADGGLNKPAYALSVDGGTWSPNVGDSNYLLNMSGYANWDKADVNGGNTIIRDSTGLWHLFFNDFSATAPSGVHHATSTDFVNYTYQGESVSSSLVPQDVKAFQYNGQTYYFGLYHYNQGQIWATLSQDLSNMGTPATLFKSSGVSDQYITSAGFVQEGNRIYGILYGAGTVTSLDQNGIFAVWLQKKVKFVSNVNEELGDTVRAFGPSSLRLYIPTNENYMVGKFYVYDTDGTTLLYISPTTTIHPGDVFRYTGS